MSVSEEGEPGHSGQAEREQREPPPMDFLRQQAAIHPSLFVGVLDPNRFCSDPAPDPAVQIFWFQIQPGSRVDFKIF